MISSIMPFLKSRQNLEIWVWKQNTRVEQDEYSVTELLDETAGLDSLFQLLIWSNIQITDVFRLCSTVRYALAITEHLPLQSKSLCKVMARASYGVQIRCAHLPGKSAKTEKIPDSNDVPSQNVENRKENPTEQLLCRGLENMSQTNNYFSNRIAE